MLSDKKIQEFGLSDKEAKVYMSLLELGQATAQQLSLRSGVNRATVYVMLESLMKRGLASTVDKDGKTFFMIEEPFALLKHLEQEKADAEDRIAAARKVIPELQLVYNLSRDRSKVRLVEGQESVRVLQNDILRSKKKDLCIITNPTLALNQLKSPNDSYREKLIETGFSVRRVVCLTDSESISDFQESDVIETRYILEGEYPISSEIAIYDNKKIVHLTLKGNLIAVLLENEEIYNTMQVLFNALWGIARTK